MTGVQKTFLIITIILACLIAFTVSKSWFFAKSVETLSSELDNTNNIELYEK